MSTPAYRVLTHGGAGSSPKHKDGTDKAALCAMETLRRGENLISAVCAGVEALEDDPRFNAGTGASLRLDGKTIQMDASCTDSRGSFGAVAVVERVKNPVRVAQAVFKTPHTFLAGEGATRFARQCGFRDYDPSSEHARRKYEKAKARLMGSIDGPPPFEWTRESAAKAWNFETPFDELFGASDTVGCVASDGEYFASALSSGGPTMGLLGRVGDVPILGAGLYAGPFGAVAATGAGEAIMKNVLAFRVHQWLEGSLSSAEALEKALSLFPDAVDFGVIILGKKDLAGGSNRAMAWSSLEA